MKRKWWQKKRAYVTAIMILYVIAKIYVSYTVNPHDDTWPDRARDILLRLVMIDPASSISEV